MGEFTTPYSSISRKDIRHLYSVFPGPGHGMPSLRHTSPYASSESLNLRQQSDSDLKKSVLRTSKFEPTRSNSGHYIPRAPAFRALSNEDIKPITERVTKPTLASDYKRHYSELAESVCSNAKSMDHAKDQYPKYMGLRKVEKVEMTSIVGQLTRPTLISEIRHRHAAHNKDHVRAVEKCKERVYGKNPRLSLRRLPRTEAIINSMTRFKREHSQPETREE